MAKPHTIAQTKYDRYHCRTMNLKFNLVKDADVIAKLDTVKSKQGYIRQLIRNDIKAGKEGIEYHEGLQIETDSRQ